MHLECNFHNPSPPCSTAICKRKHAPKACTCIMECVEAWINSFKIWWWLCTKGQVSVMPIFEDEGHTTLSEWLWMQPIQRVKQFRLQKSNRMWWPVDMQSLRGHVWGETNGWRERGCEVSIDLVWTSRLRSPDRALSRFFVNSTGTKGSCLHTRRHCIVAHLVETHSSRFLEFVPPPRLDIRGQGADGAAQIPSRIYIKELALSWGQVRRVIFHAADSEVAQRE